MRCLSLALLLPLAFAPSAFAGKACGFDAARGQFSGSALEQAACLMRPVKLHGIAANAPAELPEGIASRVGRRFEIPKARIEAYLERAGIDADDLGGALSEPLSRNEDGHRARYFVIHDTSEPLSSRGFPANIDSAAFAPNRLRQRSIRLAHVFISRDGKSASAHDYSEAYTSTKRERKQGELRGLMLHHELVQPRIKGRFGYHAIAPSPGFPKAQLRRLALLYIVASARGGEWLIPAFHAVLDQNIPNGHDDPQNFDAALWAAQIEELSAEIQR